MPSARAAADQSLIAQKLGDAEARLYASTQYLSQIGDLATPADALNAHFIGLDENEQYLQGLIAHGLPVTPAHFRIRCASHLAHWAMVKQALGIGVAPVSIGDPEASVERALPWLKPFAYPIWLVAHRELLTSRRVRLVYDFLADELKLL